MSLLDIDLGERRQWGRVGDYYAVTKKPRGLDRSSFETIPFAPMDAIPQGGAYASAFALKSPDAIASGTYFERGDILVAKITPSFENGKQALAFGLPAPFGYATTEVIPLHPREAVHDRRLLFFYLLHPDIRHHVAERMEGSTGRKRVPENVLLDLPIPTLETGEQTAIADSLELIQRASAAEANCERSAQALKRAAMRTLFTRGLRGEAQKETESGPVPESWEQTTLRDLCQELGGALQTGPFGSQLHKDDYQETGVAVVNPTHMDAGRIVHDKVPRISEDDAHRLQRHRLEKSDILFARRGEIGRQALVTKLEEGWLCGTGCFLVRVRSRSIDNGFLSYQFSTEASVNWLRTHAAGAIMPNLNNVVLGRLPVFYPGSSEQREIVTILDAIDRKIDLHRKKRAVLDDLFKTLLHKLMTGEIKVGELELPDLSYPTARPPDVKSGRRY